MKLFIKIYREDDMYVAECPALAVASQGKTITEAKKMIKEALEIFIEGCYKKGTLFKVLEKKKILSLNVYKEDNTYTGRCPELDVSSCGDTEEEALEMTKEALEAYFYIWYEMGVLFNEALGKKKILSLIFFS